MDDGETGIMLLLLIAAAVWSVALYFRLQKQRAEINGVKQKIHDIRNLLTGIYGSADVLALKLADNPELKSYAEVILQGGEQVRRMLSGDDDKCEFRNLSLNECVNETLKLLSNGVAENIKIENFCQASPDIINGNADLVRRLVLNLGVNAAEAMPEGGVLQIRTKNCEPDKDEMPQVSPHVPSGRYVMLEISDTGCGIEPFLRERMFHSPFTTKTGSGHGIGLSVVKEVVRKHGAELIVDSKVGEGSRFKIYFPAVGNLLNVRILIADDDKLLRDLLGEMLTAAGATVLKAGSGQEALDMCTRYPKIDAVMLDMVMPEMNGLQLYEILRQKKPDLKAVFVSGNACEDIPAGKHTAFVQKPYRMENVLGVLRLLLATEQDS